MKELGETHPHGAGPLQRAMAAYFFKYTPQRTSLYFRLAQLIKAAQWSGAVCTLNYERLLELSVMTAGLQPVINMGTTPGCTLELCLPHGCCHIFCDGARARSSAVSFSAFGVTTDGPVTVITDPQQHNDRISQDAFPPVMSYFEPSKRTTAGASFITNQRARWQQLATKAEKIVAVGIRVRTNDGHIWEPIAQSNAAVIYCSGRTAGEEFHTWASQSRPKARNIVLNGFLADEFGSICRELGI